MKKSSGAYPLLFLSILILAPVLAFASGIRTMPQLFGIRIEFILFSITLIGITIFQHKTMHIALAGLIAVLLAKFLFSTGFSLSAHLFGSSQHEGEWSILVNLLGLLLGFTLLAKYFEESGIPDAIPDILPDDWIGGLMLLFIIMILSSLLDNIAAAMIGGTIALVAYKGRVHIGFLAAIIAASNAGGAGSVLGDTTTTMMWIEGVSPLYVLHATIGSIGAFLVFGIIASRQQDRYQRIQKDRLPGKRIDYMKLGIVILILLGAIITNWAFEFPALGVWIAILAGAFIRPARWNVVPKAIKGAIFLLALVTCASLMPVQELPKASWLSAFLLGFVSAVFDNIPLTKLCLDQGGYDWGILAYAVGFGGSMIWFGSSAGVALSTLFPETKSVINYVKGGWHVTLAYIVGFFLMLLIVGWHPSANRKQKPTALRIPMIDSKEKSPLLLPFTEYDNNQLCSIPF
jgi:Na+/H+ antiporter NhaD/arsenite permease-like protein